jgi:hypothetical protein
MSLDFVPDSAYSPAPPNEETGSSMPEREPIRHLLTGSPKAVRITIHQLHSLGYAEVGAWSRMMPTANPGEVMSILTKYLRLD